MTDKHASHHVYPGHYPFAIAVIFNLGYTLIQAGFALSANSMSLLADAGHNLGDVLALMLAWGANWLLTLPTRQRYSYGFKRTTILAALTNALFIVAAAVLIAYESILKLFHPLSMNAHIVIIVALIGIVINSGTALLFMKGSKNDLNIKSAFYHLMSDALISLGVVIAALLQLWTGTLWIDPIAGLLIVLIILQGTRGLLRDSITLLLDAVPHYINHHGVKQYLSQLPGVSAIHDLHIWGLSTREIALTAHLVMPEKTLSDEDYKNINQVLCNEYHIHHVTLQVEQGNLEHPCVIREQC